MRFLWWGRQEPEFYTERPAKKKPTLHQLADQILMKEMRHDSTYGLKAAEKIRGISKDKATSGLEELKDLANVFGIDLKDLGKGGKGQGGGLLGVISAIPEAISEFRQMQAEAWERQKEQLQLAGQLPQQPELQPQPPIQQPEPTKRLRKPTPKPAFKLTLGELTDLIEMEPEEVIEYLKSREDEQAKEWLKMLKTKTYEELMVMIEPAMQDPTYGAILKQKMEEKADWLKELIELAHNIP